MGSAGFAWIFVSGGVIGCVFELCLFVRFGLREAKKGVRLFFLAEKGGGGTFGRAKSSQGMGGQREQDEGTFGSAKKTCTTARSEKCAFCLASARTLARAT